MWLQIDHLAVSRRNAGIRRGLRKLPKRPCTAETSIQCRPPITRMPSVTLHTALSFAAASICLATPGLLVTEGRSAPSSLVEGYFRCSSYHRITRSARSRLCFSRLNEWPAPGYKTNSVFTPYRLRPRYIS